MWFELMGKIFFLKKEKLEFKWYTHMWVSISSTDKVSNGCIRYISRV